MCSALPKANVCGQLWPIILSKCYCQLTHFQLENSGDPPDFTNYYQDGDGGGLSYWNCVYFLMVTMSTVGKYILLHVWNLIDKIFKKILDLHNGQNKRLAIVWSLHNKLKYFCNNWGWLFWSIMSSRNYYSKGHWIHHWIINFQSSCTKKYWCKMLSGYGDVSCQTVLGKMFLVLFLLVGLVCC